MEAIKIQDFTKNSCKINSIKNMRGSKTQANENNGKIKQMIEDNVSREDCKRHLD